MKIDQQESNDLFDRFEYWEKVHESLSVKHPIKKKKEYNQSDLINIVKEFNKSLIKTNYTDEAVEQWVLTYLKK